MDKFLYQYSLSIVYPTLIPLLLLLISASNYFYYFSYPYNSVKFLEAYYEKLFKGLSFLYLCQSQYYLRLLNLYHRIFFSVNPLSNYLLFEFWLCEQQYREFLTYLLTSYMQIVCLYIPHSWLILRVATLNM